VGLSPLSEEQLDFEMVYDLIYEPEQTRLLQLASKKGLETISGLEMFLEASAEQFEFWTGIDPERQLMRDIIRG
jgi:shikimate 5-dehydrogenase